jgi:hypothetical protein
MSNPLNPGLRALRNQPGLALRDDPVCVEALRPQDTPGLGGLTPTDRLRLRRGAEHLHRLGPRAYAEFILEISTTRRCRQHALERLDQWRGLTPELVRAAGGDQFPAELALIQNDSDDDDAQGETRG